MITRDYENSIQKLRGLSTDTKPTDVPNGAEFLEMNTGTLYRFNAVNSQWIEQAGTGGGSNISVEPLSVFENGTYDAPSGTAYSPVTVDVPSGIETVVVTYTIDERTGNITGDKTYRQIQDEINVGSIVVADMISGNTTTRGHLMSSSDEGVYFAFGGPAAVGGPYTIMGIRHDASDSIAIFPYTVSPEAVLRVRISYNGGTFTCDHTWSEIHSAIVNNVPVVATIEITGGETHATTSFSVDNNENISFFTFAADSNGIFDGYCFTITQSNAVYYGTISQ